MTLSLPLNHCLLFKHHPSPQKSDLPIISQFFVFVKSFFNFFSKNLCCCFALLSNVFSIAWLSCSKLSSCSTAFLLYHNSSLLSSTFFRFAIFFLFCRKLGRNTLISRLCYLHRCFCDSLSSISLFSSFVKYFFQKN